MFADTRIRSGVSWFRWQSVDAVWHGVRKASIHVMRAMNGAPWALNLSGGVRFIAWRLRRPFFRWMLTALKAFLEPSGVSGVRSLKKPYATLARLVGMRQIPVCLIWMACDVGGWWFARLLLYVVFLPGFVQNSTYHSCVVLI